MATLLDLITEAFVDAGVKAPGEVPNATQADIGLRKMNGLLDQWKAERLNCYTVGRATATLTASQTSFTVGPSGNIAITPRPVYIDHVTYVDNSVTPAVEISLGELLNDDQYAAIVQKSLTSTRPSRAYYRPDFPTGTLIPWPISTGSSLLWAVYYAVPIDEYTAVTTTVSLPPGFKRMMVSNLALELLPAYSREAHPILMKAADQSKGVVKRSNERARLLQFPAESLIGSGSGAPWSILTGP